MKKEDIIKQLMPGIFVGLILGFILVNIVGVNPQDSIPNYIGGVMCCLLPTLLNCVIVLKGTAKTLNRKLSLFDAFVRAIPFFLCAGLIGLFIVAIIVEKVMGIDTRTITVLVTAIYQAILGVIVSTIFAFIALKKYEKDVKYTKRKM